ncbi:excinuclease ABC subunit UvrA [Paraflavitalea pollutisoli]|uniref:excinuclease ABC subunit UvrA n=1 Tax=Paraflavitalea pollutisoli TaxID=3034143 RepID=UPI0023EADB9F|nr:excinuclease ABC subunit UvrA [Paraflavitalea sp. H1-2-19X]
MISIRGAREHNLKNLSLDLPKHQLIVFTGVSGSGKSSLVFDTIAAESQRHLNETYDSFIRHRLPHYGQPDVDSIAHLPVAIIIDQKRIGGNARSTVGTATEIFTLLRLLYSRVGKPFVGYSNVFSFNNPVGMCPHCQGLGTADHIDIDALIDKNRSLNEGAIDFPSFQPGGWRWKRYVYAGLFDNDKKLKDYTTEEWDLLLYADDLTLANADPHEYPKTSRYEGVIPRFERSFLKRDTDEIKGKNKLRFQQVVSQGTCPVCKGTRLNEKILSCRIDGKHIADCAAMQVDELLVFMRGIDARPADTVRQAIVNGLQHLLDIGLGYLSLDRETATLSGGESQRIKMVKHLGNSLSDLVYIFDEPSVGLHPGDVDRLNGLIRQLRDKGNTILIVEHDPDIILTAEHIVDMGPRAGEQGGEIVYQGSLEGLKAAGTLTGEALARRNTLKADPRKATGQLSIKNARLHNLKNISVNIPTGVLTVVTGVAGSGKSTLINRVLSKQHPTVRLIDQSALTGSKRSNLLTYMDMADEVRRMYAAKHKVSASLFSTNAAGACPECKGLGVITTDLAFMDAVEETCEVCNGSGFKPEVLQYELAGKNIHELLRMTVAEASRFLTRESLQRPLVQLAAVGLDYIRLGQPLSSFSGGERQRVKLAAELQNSGQVYVFDEPTTGLHLSDIGKLLQVFDNLIAQGSTVIVIEHDLQVMSQADWIIDMGPGAGHEGGTVVFQGTVQDIVTDKHSLTGRYLKAYSER